MQDSFPCHGKGEKSSLLEMGLSVQHRAGGVVEMFRGLLFLFPVHGAGLLLLSQLTQLKE